MMTLKELLSAYRYMDKPLYVVLEDISEDISGVIRNIGIKDCLLIMLQQNLKYLYMIKEDDYDNKRYS